MNSFKPGTGESLKPDTFGPDPNAPIIHPDPPEPLSETEAVMITAEEVKKMFPPISAKNIDRYLPDVLAGLKYFGLVDYDMVLMALATIRAESEGFAPISEKPSKYNTSEGGAPFDKYDGRFGNDQPGDGERYKGRGFIQLTFKANYRDIGAQIDVDLVGNPDIANAPHIAGRILGAFLKNKENAIRLAIGGNNLALARKQVNGGSHGLDRFTDAFEKGRMLV